MDDRILFILGVILLTVHNSETVINSSRQPDISLDSTEEPPEGYYAFIESPGAEPPKVRRPPYVQSDIECPGIRSKQSLRYCNSVELLILTRNKKKLSNLISNTRFEGTFAVSPAFLALCQEGALILSPTGLKKNKGKMNPHVYKTLSLCGDLNKGYIPKNPMMMNVLGSAYPFELIKNKTLQFFSKVLPILKADDTLPKVAKYQYFEDTDNKIAKHLRVKRNSGLNTTVDGVNLDSKTTRTARKFCDNNDGVLCLLYKAFQGDSILTPQAFHDRKDEVNNETPEYRRGETTLPAVSRENSLPPTPCPAKVEYVTPVFARNYQGVWRYVVQIPYEGYFTQTIEVTRCLNSRCHYLEGSCMSSPRWTSVLVAEIYYPKTYLPSKPLAQSTPGSSWPGQTHRHPVSSENPPPVQDFQNYQQYLQKRAGLSPGGENFDASSSNDSKKSMQCDGVDEIGCFQVRLYYDWFLVPGSCKCWKPDYFSRYMRRKPNSPEF